MPPFVTCAYREADGSLLFGARHGLWQLRDHKITRLTAVAIALNRGIIDV